MKNSGENILEKDYRNNAEEINNTLSNVRGFFANQISTILSNKTYSAAAFAAILSVGMNISDSNSEQESEGKQPISSQITLKETQNQGNQTKLGSVYFDGYEYNVNINEELIRSQAEKYHLDYEILKGYIEINEISTFNFINYLPQSEYDNQENKYTYTQLVEAVQDIESIEYLIEQQSLSEGNQQKSQRIFNEKLRSKQKVRYLGSDRVKDSDRYDLILAAADYNYEFVFGEKYSDENQSPSENQNSMKKVTQKIDYGELSPDALITYSEQLKYFIEFETGVNLDEYKSYIASIQKTELIAKNNMSEKRIGYE